MARKSKNRSRNPYIVVFWEGESEQQYFMFIKDKFHEKTNLKIHNKKGTFDIARKSVGAKGVYKDDVDYIDEIWIVFDTEVDLRPKWQENWEIIKLLRKKCKNAKVRLLMTKGCIEYFFLLHYEKTAPMISTTVDKEKLLNILADDKHCPGYKKGDRITIWKIAENYITAIKNGEWSLNRVKDELATASNEDDKTKILYFTDSTFTNVHEVLAEHEQSIN